MLSYWLERLEEVGLKDVAQKVRSSLPSQARKILKEAEEKNEEDIQRCMREKGIYRHTKYTDREMIIRETIKAL